MLSPGEQALARAVLVHGPITRRSLAARLSLSPASLTRLAKPFLDRGLFVELDDEVAAGRIGRPVRPLDVAPSGRRFVGVKLTAERVYAVSTDMRAAQQASVELPLTSRDPHAVARLVADAVHALDVAAPAGVGVCLGGAVRDGVVEHAPFLGWSEVDFAALLEDAVAAPVTIDNDVLALAEAEHWFGAGRGLEGFSLVTIGAGVGHALVVHDEVLRSREAGVGLVGHLPLDPDGPVCARGHRGCAQSLLTSGSITAQVAERVGSEVGYDEVLDLAAAGDPRASPVVARAADALGRLLALVANVTQQPRVVLAGDGVRLHVVAEDRVRQALGAHRDPRADPVEVFVDPSGFAAWARGAAAVAIQAAVRGLELSSA